MGSGVMGLQGRKINGTKAGLGKKEREAGVEENWEGVK